MSNLFRKLWTGKGRLALAVVLAVLIVLVASYRIDNTPPPLREGEISLDASSPPPAEVVRRGESLVQLHCACCHGCDLRGMKKDSAGEVVSLGANISSEGRCSTYTADDFCKVVREGLRPDGSPLSGPMPAVVTRDLSDDDLHAIWTYSRNAPAPNEQ
jgi:mono/diheme cytochrome c family protein